MKIEARKDQVYERKADSQGRISLSASQFAGKELELVVTDVIDEDEEEKEVSEIGQLVRGAMEIAAEDVGKQHVEPSDAVSVLDAAKKKAQKAASAADEAAVKQADPRR